MLPYINETRKSRVYNEEFLGIRQRSRISEKEAYDSYNLTNDDYPVLSTRKPRGKLGMTAVFGEVLAMLGGEGLAVLSHVGTDLYFTYDNGKRFEKNIGKYREGEAYHLVRMGARIVCYPTCYVYNTADGTEESFLTMNTASAGVVIENYVNAFGEKTLVDRYYDGEYSGYCLQVIEEDGVLTYQVMKGTNPISTPTYIKISGLDIKKGDVFEHWSFLGFGASNEGAFQWKLNEDNKTIIVEDGAVYIPGLTCQLSARIVGNGKGLELSRDRPESAASGTVTLEHTDGSKYGIKYSTKFRRFDQIVECKNRLWACLYDGNINEIYATKLGSYSEWTPQSDVLSDSAYVVSVGSYGPFTGACVYGDNPIFFKEDFVHKVYVSSTGAHQVYNVPCKGVEEGSSASIAELGGYLYYKARGGFVRFDGTSTAEISEPIDGGKYKNAVAGIEADKYVTACQSHTGEPFIFVYDAKYGTWQREHTEIAIRYMEEYRGRLCLADESVIMYHELREGDETDESHVRYMLETGDIGFSEMEKKYICRLEARVRLELGASFNVWIQYDSDGRWISLRRAVGERCTPKVDTVHVMPRRCDHFRLRITGKGEMKLYGITRVYEEGESV